MDIRTGLIDVKYKKKRKILLGKNGREEEDKTCGQGIRQREMNMLGYKEKSVENMRKI